MSKPKILFIDIETSPNTAHVWGLFRQTVSISQLMESSYVMCFAAKWYGKTKVEFMENGTSCEYMLGRLHELLDEADIVVHYNGSKFDIPTINKEFLLAGMDPPKPYQQIDLYRVVRNKFRFPSNKLDYVADRLGIGRKHAHEGHELWVKCMNGDRDAWKRMEKYNKQDVKLLEHLYERVLPWIDKHPNYGVYLEKDRPCCTNCGSYKVTKQGKARTKTRVYQQYKCSDCGTWLRTRLSEKKSSPELVQQGL